MAAVPRASQEAVALPVAPQEVAQQVVLQAVVLPAAAPQEAVLPVGPQAAVVPRVARGRPLRPSCRP